MANANLERIRQMAANRQQQNSKKNNRVRGIFFEWEDGDNILRLVGTLLEVRTHFIAPSPTRKSRGLCIPAAFMGDERLAQTINCIDWDIEKAAWKKQITCPVCQLRRIARKIVKESPDLTPEDQKFYEDLQREAAPSPKVKWNVIDRKNPYVIATDNGTEMKILGMKIATISTEAWKDIEGIFEQCNCDIADTEEGVDICVVKGNNGVRVSYSAKAVIDGRSLKVTPLTPEERALQLHDLKAITGKQVEPQKVINALHEDLRKILEDGLVLLTDQTESTAGAEKEAQPEPVAQPAAKAAVAAVATQKPATTGLPQRTVAKAPVTAKPVTKAEPSSEEAEAIVEALEDEDALLDGTSAQKKS